MKTIMAAFLIFLSGLCFAQAKPALHAASPVSLSPVVMPLGDLLSTIADPSAPATADNTDQILGLVAQLVDNWSTLRGLGLMIVFLNLSVALLKSRYSNGWFEGQDAHVKAGLIVILGQVLAILSLRSQGATWMAALVTGLFVSGGAVSVYELVVKPLRATGALDKLKARVIALLQPAPKPAAPVAPVPEAPKTDDQTKG